MKLKRLLSVITASSMLFAMSMTSSAAVSSNVVVEREDVSIEEAVTDLTFNPVASAKSAKSITPRATSWNVWGEKSSAAWIGLDLCYYPIGYSEHVKDGVVLNTYHYTRTYLDDIFSKRGDSERNWGYGTVKATGTYVVDEIWSKTVHKVKYGTQD